MNSRTLLILFLLLSLYSCTVNKKENKYKDKFYHAFIEIRNAHDGQYNIDGAHVFIKDDLVTKICLSDSKGVDDCIDNFDMWDPHDHYQLVFAKGNDDRIYKVYIIPDEWEDDEPEQVDEDYN